MKWAIGSLIIQKIVLEISGNILFNIIISAIGAYLILELLFGKMARTGFLMKLFATMVFLRYAVLVAALCNNIADRAFLSEKIDGEMDGLERIQDELDGQEDAMGLPEELKTSLSSELAGLRSSKDAAEKSLGE